MNPQAAQRQPQMGSLLRLQTDIWDSLDGWRCWDLDDDTGWTVLKCGSCGFYLIELRIERLLFHSSFVL